MYNELVGQTIKIVHRDGDRIEISIGDLEEYDSELKTLKIIKSSGKIVFINAMAIDKLEVVQ